MGLFAPVAAYLAARIGTRRAMTIGLALIGVFGVLRATMPSAWLVVLLTWPVGIGMGLGNALAPISVKEHFERAACGGHGRLHDRDPDRLDERGCARRAACGLVRRLAWRADRHLVRGALVSLVAWVVLTWGDSRTRPPPATVPAAAVAQPHRLAPRRDLRADGTARTTASTPGSRTPTPSAAGATARPGVLLATMNLTAIPASFVVPWLSDRTGRRSPFLLGLSLCFVAGAVVLVAAPGLAYAGALTAGIAQGGLFALVMTLPLDFERTPKRVGALVAMMLGLGYTIGAASPFVLGAIRDATARSTPCCGSRPASSWRSSSPSSR